MRVAWVCGWCLFGMLLLNGDTETTAAVLEKSRPNIVVFLVDDMGIMDTSVPFLTDAEGNPQRFPLNDYYHTPAMERLAAKGIRFNNFSAMSVCSPTRVSIMTGQNAARHRTTNWINPDQDNAGPLGPPDWNWLGLNSDSITLASEMRKAGYRTLHVGKGHWGPRSAPGGEPLNLGYDINLAGASIGAPGSYFGLQNFGWGGRRERNAVPHLEKYHGTDIFLTEALTQETLKLVDQAAAEPQPFFLHFAHYAVHAPFQTDPRFAARYADSGKPEQAQAFATLIEGMDKSLGDLLDHLDKQGIAEETLIFFLSDNGGDAPLGHQHDVACVAPLRGKKGAHYEGGMRVPFIAAWAKTNDKHPLQQKLPIPANTIQPQMASICDLFPTILQLVGADLPEGHIVDGFPLQKLLLGQADDSRPETFLMHYPHAPHRSDYWTSFRAGPWKVIYHYIPSEASENSHYQLFHLGEDPYEQNNLAEEKPDQLRRMMQRLIKELESHAAVFPRSESGEKRLHPQLP